MAVGAKTLTSQALKVKAASAQVFAQLKSEMAKSGIKAGITTNQFIFNRMAAYAGLRAKDEMVGIDGQPFILSPAGKMMDSIAKTSAKRLGAICQANQLDASSFSAVMDGVFALSTREPYPSTLSQRMKTAKMSPLPGGPKPPSQFPSKSFEPGLASSSYQRSAIRGMVPVRSSRAAEQARYDARLESLTADLRSLLLKGPEKIGPIPAAKREYVEQLLALIDEHHQSYKAGRVSKPFRFSHDEKSELENFCPAFKLTGLDWLELEGKPPSSS